MLNASRTGPTGPEDAHGEHGLQKLSVIIANYNHADFVGQAIESALALDWPDVEIIVVDDGSTDGSRKVIASYENRVTAVYQQNKTQRVARNVGFALSTGDAVVHLDSDDLLHPGLVRRVAAVWSPEVSKVQVLMRSIDRFGDPLGRTIPRLRSEPTPQQMRSWLTKTSAYPTPPGSGNVYSRRFLEQIFPLDERCGPATDSACLAAAPVLGDVITVAEELVSYRIHGANTSNMLASSDTFARAIQRAIARHEFRWSIDPATLPVNYDPLFRSRELLQFRIADARLNASRGDLPGGRTWKLWRDTFRTLWAPGHEGPIQRIVIAIWAFAALVASRSTARALIEWRYRRG